MAGTQIPKVEMVRHITQVIPLFWILVGAAAVTAIGELMLIVIAARRPAAGDQGAAEKRASAWLAIAAMAGPALLAGLLGVSLHIGHETLLRGIAATQPDENVQLVLAGLEAFLNVKALGPLLLLPLLGLAVVAASLQAAATLRVRPLPLVMASLLFVVAGLGPFLWGTFNYSTRMIKVLASGAGLDVAFKAEWLATGFAETREVLDRWAMVGSVGFGVALAVAIAIVVRAGVRSDGHRVAWWSPMLCLLAAAVLCLATERLRAENTLPWPPSVGSALTNNVVATPELEGPDPISPAVVVAVTNDLMLGDRLPQSPSELRDLLVVMRRNYRLLHPSSEVDESLVIVCAPDTRSERLIQILQLAALTEHRRPELAFGRRTTLDRPLMGTLPRWQWTAAKALLPGIDPEVPMPVVTLAVQDYPSCDAVARAVTDIRRSGKIASLVF